MIERAATRAEPSPIVIPQPLLAAACAHARAAAPLEVCGWLGAARHSPGVASSLRLCSNAAASGARFAFADDDLLAFVCAFGSDEPPAAVFHSHPGGNAAPSPVDIGSWLDPRGLPLYPVQQLVIAPGRSPAAALFAYWPAAHGFVEVARFTEPRS
jgi:proteasome lid subunit RPN8/RPN11